MRSGKYAYRFVGSSLQPGWADTWHLVGLGTIDLDGNGTEGIARNGRHRASIHRLGSSNPSFTHSLFSVTGNYAFDKEEAVWKSTLIFEQLERSDNRPLQILTGAFVLVSAGDPDRYWIVSAGASVTVDGKTSPASEVVEGTLVRTGDLF
jgi:hypothetical protein